MGKLDLLLKEAQGGGRSNVTLYHGTSQVFEKPVLGFGRDDNDYGSGFYLTEDFNRAADWACEFGGDRAYVNVYSLSKSSLNILKFGECGPLSWIAEVAKNRIKPIGQRAELYREFIDMYCIDTSPYDAIIGLCADDSRLDLVREFFNGTFNAIELQSILMEEGPGLQFCLKSKKAFDEITFLERIEVKGAKSRFAEARIKNLSRPSERKRQMMADKNFKVGFPTFVEAIDRKLEYNSTGGYYA